MKSTHRHGTPTRREARLIFRAPAAQLSAAELLGRAVPEALREVQVDAFREGAVEVAGRTHRDASGPVAPGAQVSVTGALSEQLGLPAALEHAPTARALVPALPWSRGELGEAGERFRFEQTVRRGALAEVRLVDVEGEPLVLEGVLGALARLGHAVIGDAWHGGILASGGLRVLREEAADPLGLVAARAPPAGHGAPIGRQGDRFRDLVGVRAGAATGPPLGPRG